MLVLRKDQMEAFSQSAERGFETRLRAHLKGAEAGSQQTSVKWDANTVRSVIDKAQSYGMRSEREVLEYAQLALALGPEFDTDPKHSWCVPILMDPELVADSKIDALRKTPEVPSGGAIAKPDGFNSEPPGSLVSHCARGNWKLEVTVVCEPAGWPRDPVRVRLESGTMSRAATALMQSPVSVPCVFLGREPISYTVSAAVLGWELVRTEAVALKAPGLERVTLTLRPVADPHWLSIELVGADDKPLAGQPYQVRLRNGLIVSGVLTSEGQAKVQGIPDTQPCEVTFPNLDQDVWEAIPPGGATEGARAATAHKPYPVKAGECVSSIGFKLAMLPETIWTDPANSDLSAERADDGNVLAEGDVLQIPVREPGWRKCVVDSHHRFRRKGFPEKLVVQFQVSGEPRSREPYVLDIDGVVSEGETDKNGVLDTWIRPDAKLGKLEFKVSGDRYTLQLGRLTPASAIAGCKERLTHLGLYLGEINDAADSGLEGAVRVFQRMHKIDSDGVLNEVTKAKLRSAHGS